MKTDSLKRLVLLFGILSLGACATTPQETIDPVVERAEQRWEALLGNDLEGAYEFYSPGYRSTVSIIDFGVEHRLRRIRWTGAEYIDHTCEGQRCILRFDVDFSVKNAVPGVPVFNHHAEHQETWIKTEGQWWYLPEK